MRVAELEASSSSWAATSSGNLPIGQLAGRSTLSSSLSLKHYASFGRPMTSPRCKRLFSNCSRCHSSSGDPHKLHNSNPFEVLGLSEDCTQEDIKAAFRIKVLLKRIGVSVSKRLSVDPFDTPECEAQEVFVCELDCIGRGCPYSCVERAPSVFQFAPETGCARAVSQGRIDDYEVQLAVGQCPRNCIYYVTPLQRQTLERVLERALEGTFYSNEVALLESLLARAKFENGRYAPSKREAKTSTEWVDWY